MGFWSYLLAQVLEQKRLDRLNWLAGANLRQYSHFNSKQTQCVRERENINIHRQLKQFFHKALKHTSTHYQNGRSLGVGLVEQPQEVLSLAQSPVNQPEKFMCVLFLSDHWSTN